MNNVMTYRGYTARVEFDQRDRIFVGRVIGIPETISFHGETVTELTKDFQAAINHYIADCRATDRKPHKSDSVRLQLSLPRDVHAHAAKMAEAEGKSIDEWAAEVLSQAAA